jgi:PAS domain S-box-containing protein
MRDGRAEHKSVPLLRPDGSLAYADVVSSLITYNRRPCWISFFHNITDRVRAEEALRQSEQKYKGLVEASPDAVIIADVKGTVLFASRHAGEFVGLSDQEDLAGRSVFDFVVESDRPRMAASVPELMKTRIRRNTEYTLQRPDGSTFPAEISAAAGPNTEEQPWAILAVIRDISERKRAEEAIRQSEEKYRGLVDICPDAIVVSDLTGKTRFVSKQTWKLLGVPEEKELVGEDTFDYVIEADRPRLAANYAELLNTGTRSQTDYTVRRPDGTTVPIELSSVVNRDANGRPTGAMSIIRDISERKQTQEALRQSEEKHRGLLAICPDSVVVTDLVGNAQFLSKQTWKLLRIPEDVELVGQSVFNYIVEADRPRLAGNIAKLLGAGRQGNMEYTALRPDGTTIPTELSSAVIRDAQGQPMGLMAMIRDISERKRTEETLRQSEEKYRGLVEISPDSVIVTDLTGKALFVSPQTWKLLAVPEQQQLVGESLLDHVIEADRLRVGADIAELIEKGKQGNMEYTVFRRDGTTVPIESSSVLMRDAQGQPMALLAMIRDISERKRAEQALQQHYEELRAIYDGTSDGLSIVDIETTNTVRVNRAACDMLGYTEEELTAAPLVQFFPSDRLTELLEKHQELAEGKLLPSEDIPLLRKDGSIVYVDVTSNRITYNGRPCLIHLIRDTTERRQTQEALKKEHRTLKHLLRSSDHERQLIAYEIHDGLTQQLAGGLMQIETYWHQKDARPKDAAKAYDAAVTMLRQAHFEARRLISGVRPPILDESGIVAAIAHLVNDQRLQNQLEIEFCSEVSFHRLVLILENAVYRIVQEALANACRHSKSNRARVELVQCGDRLRIKVQDWGVGFNPVAVRDDHFGLEGIRERARLLGGATVIESAPNKGTAITVELPLVLRED